MSSKKLEGKKSWSGLESSSNSTKSIRLPVRAFKSPIKISSPFFRVVLNASF